MAENPIMNYSKTQRILLLIDLNPLLSLQDPTPYLATLLSSTTTLLSFPPLSSSLFSFKPFFSSMSPLRSSSKLSSSTSLSFDSPKPTLLSLSRFFGSIKNSNLLSDDTAPSMGAHVVASMRQLLHEYAWDSSICDTVTDTAFDNSAFVRSNLVVLFSTKPRDMKSISKFLDLGIGDECLGDGGLFKSKFRRVFEGVNDAFVARDIHFCWVDVKCEIGSSEKQHLESDDSSLNLGYFENGIRDLGWGFCSSDSIILGSALFPFGLIYPRIGVSSSMFSFNDKCKRFHVQLALEILGVDGNPLECKCSELELIRVYEQHKKPILDTFCDGYTKLNVKTLKRYDECVKLDRQPYDPFIVRELPEERGNDHREIPTEFSADQALQLITKEMGEIESRKSVPMWQILLSFLYRESYCALVSLSNGNGDLRSAILKPFTVSSAILCLVDDKLSPSISSHRERDGDKKKTSKKNMQLIKDLKWDSFCEGALDHNKLELEDIYFSIAGNNSKKLKFLKCWMKQIKKSSCCCPSRKEIETVTIQNVIEPPLEIEQSTDYALVADNSLSGTSTMQKEDIAEPEELAESFLHSLPDKIRQGLELEDIDIAALAERLVNSSILWLQKKFQREKGLESKTVHPKSDDFCGSKVVEELMKLVLKKPKQLISAHKRNNTLPNAFDLSSSESASKYIVKEYELQIFFRMEILKSELGSTIKESVKQKFVKHICLLLTTVSCHLDSDFFGDWNFNNYVGKTIKDRYCTVLEDIVHSIYVNLDLFALASEDESLDNRLNSEDSNQPMRQNPSGGDFTGDNYSLDSENYSEDLQGTLRIDDEAYKIMEAKKKRDRARRVSSHTSWMPDLRRVWAPKATKASDFSNKISKRTNRKRGRYVKVCETPPDKKQTSVQKVNNSDIKHQGHETQRGGSVHKALFQDASS